MACERINPQSVYQPFNNFYTQVIRATGNTQVHVAGTVGLDKERGLISKGDMAAQTAKTMENLGESLKAADATPADVVRVNIFTTDVDLYMEKGHPKLMAFFGDTLPVSTLVGVTRLASPDYLVEVEATAILDT